MPHNHRRRQPSPIVARPAWLVALALAAPFLTTADALAANEPEPGSWTRALARPMTAEQLGVPASAPAPRLARAALRRSAGRLGLRGSLRGLQLRSVERAPDLPGARDLRTLRFRQTAGGLRVLYSQIDVAVVDGSVTSITATVVPLKSTRLRGARRITASKARAIARRRIAGPDSALSARAIADAGTPSDPRAPRRAWVVQVTPADQSPDDDQDRNLCVVVDARSGKVIDVWEGVAARPTTSPAARSAQTTEHTLAFIRDAKFALGIDGTLARELYTRGNPFQFGEDEPFGTALGRAIGTPVVGEIVTVGVDVYDVGRHMCVNRKFCGRFGGFDGRVFPLSVTARVPAQSNPPQNDRGTRYSNSKQRVFVASEEAGSGDIMAHEFGHLMDLTYGEDRTSNIFVDEVEEAVADMFAYDFDHNDVTLGEAAANEGFPVGSPRVNWANPRLLKSAAEGELFPAHQSQFKCSRKGPHYNGTIYSHAYFLFDKKVGRGKASAVLHRVSSALGPAPNALDLRDLMIQRGGELFGTSVRNAAIAAWSEVGLAPGNEVVSQHPSCVG